MSLLSTIDITTGKPYQVYIGENLLDQVGSLISEVIAPCTALLLTDTNVAPLYAAQVVESLKAAGYSVRKSIVPAGEESKSFVILEKLLNDWSLQGLHRNGLIVTLGGGVMGDLGGFAASIYQRGIPFVQIPTTLLAAVDASVGGKTAVNIEAGKNLVGAFHQPLAVICDVKTIQTMDEAYFADGVAESIKYGILRQPTLFKLLSEQPPTVDSEHLAYIIENCVRYKNELVSQDEFDKGSRQLLNLGHTIGHAIEHLSHFQTSHGHAVAIGLAMIARASAKMGWSVPSLAGEIETALTNNHLPIDCPYTAEELLLAAKRDKKASTTSITIIVPLAIGECVLKTVDYDTLYTLITLGKEPS